MLIVAGLSLKNLKPRVWDPASPYYLSGLKAVMVSYADFCRMPAAKDAAMKVGLHKHLGIPAEVKVYLDNGAFYFLNRGGMVSTKDYEQFVTKAEPDWWPIPQDFIPTPKMALEEQRDCLTRTLEMNLSYKHDGFVPVIHVSELIEDYVKGIQADEKLSLKPRLALGGLVPNLLRAPKARPYQDVLSSLKHIRGKFAGKHVHLFGIGGTATLHLAALLQMDSADSSGWRNRAARGIVQLPGCGDRMVADLGSWRGRKPSGDEWAKLSTCSCPACTASGTDGLKADGITGFCNRATHNLWTLLNELDWIETHLADGTYGESYEAHLDNSIYKPLIDAVVAAQSDSQDGADCQPCT